MKETADIFVAHSVYEIWSAAVKEPWGLWDQASNAATFSGLMRKLGSEICKVLEFNDV